MRPEILLLVLAVFSGNLFPGNCFGVAEVTEVISVVRIGVSLVEYIYKVFSSIMVTDSGFSVTVAVRNILISSWTLVMSHLLRLIGFLNPHSVRQHS